MQFFDEGNRIGNEILILDLVGSQCNHLNHKQCDKFPLLLIYESR
jgi:hypothetical protein